MAMRILKTEQTVAAVSETLFRNISKHGYPQKNPTRFILQTNS